MNDIGQSSLSAAVPPPDATVAKVDDLNPWLGLASFTEETQAYFYGRDEEVAELARRVQRKLLTVLFGQSGLGKTSILRAGLVPRLRSLGFCPVYVRIGYGREATEPAEQIKEAIARSARDAGYGAQPGIASQGESLWEYMHHRDGVLRDAEGNTLTPLLIFDQFEEIFTLAQSDDFGRARATRFIEELADLVENRPPQSLEARLEADDSAADGFDFARSDYRVLIALREDYLAPLEGLKTAMPSVTQNRLRLAPMTGMQALTAVMKPGGTLVSEDVAAAIVRFVAGGAELANAEVEPSLLSLICRELNDARIAQSRTEISLDLLAGSHDTILQNFYERALADQLPEARRIIEDELLTASGYRENVAQESLVANFNAAGAAPGTLATLVDRRLLRIEERLDMRRVELTHDVLCAVVKSSRDLRYERESREATERLLAEQRDRELATRRALVRARQIAASCVVLALGAVAAAILAYSSTQRAHRAERLADQTRAQAEQARSGAEHLLGYLTDDFARELLGSGRVDMIAEFSQRQIEYFKSLPPSLQGVESVRNGALALGYHSRAMRQLGKPEEGIKDADESIRMLQQLRDSEDKSEATAIALARAYTAKANILEYGTSNASLPIEQRAVDLLQPFVSATNSSIAVRRAYLEALTRVAFEQTGARNPNACLAAALEAKQLAIDLGARDAKDVDAAANYAEAAAWQLNCLSSLGREDEAREAGEDALAMAGQVLTQNPGQRLALHASQVAAGALAVEASNSLNPAEQLRYGQRGEQVTGIMLGLDPLNIVGHGARDLARLSIGNAYWAAGDFPHAIATYRQALEDSRAATSGGPMFELIDSVSARTLAVAQARFGDGVSATSTLSSMAAHRDESRAATPPGSFTGAATDATLQSGTAAVAFLSSNFDRARQVAAASVRELQAVKPIDSFQSSVLGFSTYLSLHIMGQIDYLLGDYAVAEREEQQALADRKQWTATGVVSDRRDLAEVSTWLSMSLAKQGKLADALSVIAPVITLQRELAARNHGDVWLPSELAAALYAQALADEPHRPALLKEAATLLDGLGPTLKPLREIRQWRGRVSEAQKGQ